MICFAYVLFFIALYEELGVGAE